MSNRTQDEQKKVANIVLASINQNRSQTLEDLADEVESQLGIRPHASTISKILVSVGLQPKRETRWVYRHNPPKGE